MDRTCDNAQSMEPRFDSDKLADLWKFTIRCVAHNARMDSRRLYSRSRGTGAHVDFIGSASRAPESIFLDNCQSRSLLGDHVNYSDPRVTT